MIQNYIGKGLIFPVQISTTGSPVLYTGLPLIRSSLALILGWDGDRMFLPEFKSKLPDLLEEPNDIVLENLVEFLVKEQITQWEKRVTLLEVAATTVDNTKMEVKITYRIKNTNLGESLIYPFYTSLNN